MKEANSKTSTATKKGAKNGRDKKEQKKKAAKKPIKKAAKKSPPKVNDPNRDKGGKFKPGHKVKEIWTEAVVLQQATAVWNTLTTDSDGKQPEDKNMVRANDIKYLYEALIMNDITKQRWSEWYDKFAKKINEDKTINPLHSPAIAELFGKIKMLLECRLSYSGSSMDMLHLKKHFDYKEEIHVDNTTKGESVNNPFYELLKQTGISNHQKK